ncbi:MAG TPA: M14 family metallopeptidase [Arenicellales bacterium]|nr:M14 family metallopeptidase [Arenicellales bacterium]
MLEEQQQVADSGNLRPVPVPRRMNQADINACFGADYADARERFRAAAADAGVRVDELANPNAEGPRGETLTMDVARFGDRDAARVLFLTSATHGAEGFCGSGAQVALIRSGLMDRLPAGIGVVMVHAINPYGFAHLSRTTEDNVDLNRNFIDFSSPLPDSAAYDEVHPFLLPDDWDGPGRLESEEAIARYIAERGLWAFQCAVTGGQYSHADGLFYGGESPSWSQLSFRQVIGEHAGDASHVALIDFHTGLGPYGYGEPIATGDHAARARALKWYGDEVTDPDAGSSTSAPIRGFLAGAFADAAPGAAAASIALEYGTVPVPETLGALRADNWLRFRGDPDSGLGRIIKQRMRDTFYCDFDDWRAMIVTRALDMTGRALAGLESES